MNTAALDALVETERKNRRDLFIGAVEKRVEKQFQSYFRAQGRELVRNLRRYEHQFPAADTKLNEALKPSDFERELESTTAGRASLYRVLKTAYRRAVDAGARSAIADVGLAFGFDLSNPVVIDFLRNRAVERVTGIDETTRQYLRTLITQATEEGWSYSRTARAIISRYEEFAVGSPLRHIKSRAELITVQEMGEAYIHGTKVVGDGLTRAGIPLQKGWLEVGDERVCPECQAAAAEGYIDWDGSFTNGLSEPPGHIGCRCDLLTQVKTIQLAA